MQNLHVKWDGKESVFIKVDDDMAGGVVGLCGDFDHDKTNDFKNKQGKFVETASEFANSWKADETCLDTTDSLFCSLETDAGIRKASKAVMACAILTETDCRFVVDPKPYFEACREDFCWNNEAREESSYCNAMSAYFRECARHGVQVNWRSDSRCPAQCGAGLEYQLCGTSSPATCANQDPIIDDGECVDGCHCPKDLLLHENQCIEKSQCPCVYGRQEYASRSRIVKDCNQCVCMSGKWYCTKNRCDGVCQVTGNNYLTFDGKEFSMESGCDFVLMKDEAEDSDYEISVSNKDCAGTGWFS